MATSTAKPKKTETKLEIDPETPAQVVETRRGGQVVSTRVSYEAGVKEVEVTDDDSETEFDDPLSELANSDPDGLPFIDEPNTETIPQTGLDRMFNHIRSAILDDRVPDAFFAQVYRVADHMGANYRAPCTVPLMELGTFQFSSRDRLPFTSQLQKINGNSGGIFNVRIYKQDGQPLNLYRRSRSTLNDVEVEVGATNLAVPDPILDMIETPGMPQESSVVTMVMRSIEASDRRNAELIAAMQQAKAPSELEQAMTRKMINDMVNPTTPPDPMGSLMGVLMNAQLFQQRITDVMLPARVNPPDPIEPDGWDKAMKFLDSPLVDNVLGRVIDVSERVAVAKLAPGSPDPAAESETDPADMTDLIEKIVLELQGDRVLDANNPVIIELANEYPEQVEQLEMMCSMPFANLQRLLVADLNKKLPNVLRPFLDVPASQAKGAFVFNPDGTRLMARLKEFYDFVQAATAAADEPADIL